MWLSWLWSGSFLWFLEEWLLAASNVGMIYQGHVDQTFGMPILGLILNLCWSFLFTFDVDGANRADPIMLALHLIILLQVIWYGPKEFAFGGTNAENNSISNKFRTGWPLYLLLVGCTVPCLGLMGALVQEEGWDWSHNQLFYLLQLITAVQFLSMLASRGNARGQRLFIPITKSLALLMGWIYQPTSVSSWACFTTILVNVLYIVALHICFLRPSEFVTWRNYLWGSPNQPNVGGSPVLMSPTSSINLYPSSMQQQPMNELLLNNSGVVYEPPIQQNEPFDTGGAKCEMHLQQPMQTK